MENTQTDRRRGMEDIIRSAVRNPDRVSELTESSKNMTTKSRPRLDKDTTKLLERKLDKAEHIADEVPDLDVSDLTTRGRPVKSKLIYQALKDFDVEEHASR